MACTSEAPNVRCLLWVVPSHAGRRMHARAQSRAILLSSDSEAEEEAGPLSTVKRWFTGGRKPDRRALLPACPVRHSVPHAPRPPPQRDGLCMPVQDAPWLPVIGGWRHAVDDRGCTEAAGIFQSQTWGDLMLCRRPAGSSSPFALGGPAYLFPDAAADMEAVDKYDSDL